jgi:hypothetical protein
MHEEELLYFTFCHAGVTTEDLNDAVVAVEKVAASLSLVPAR